MVDTNLATPPVELEIDAEDAGAANLHMAICLAGAVLPEGVELEVKGSVNKVIIKGPTADIVGAAHQAIEMALKFPLKIIPKVVYQGRKP